MMKKTPRLRGFRWKWFLMNNRYVTTCFGLAVFLCTFLWYRQIIIGNTVEFQTDEVYWISTAKILPLLYRRDLNNPFWNEFWGFVNFNGAKILYSTGLLLMGHTFEQISSAGSPPDTYYDWIRYEADIRFPSSHPFYPLLRDARLISAVFTAGSVSLLSLLLCYLYRGYLCAITGAVLFGMHPLMVQSATHALADGFFIFFQIIFLMLISYFCQDRLFRKWMLILPLIGADIAILTAIKLNGIFFILLWFQIVLLESNNKEFPKTIIPFTVPVMAFLFVFSLMHPNLIFYPQRSLSSMIQDRIRITASHMEYFGSIDPGHVLRSPITRLGSLWKSIFAFPVFCLTIAGVLSVGFDILKNRKRTDIPILSLGLPVIGSLLIYVVFDEPRYFLPLLPYVVLISVRWISPLCVFSRSVLKRFRNMGNHDRFFTG